MAHEYTSGRLARLGLMTPDARARSVEAAAEVRAAGIETLRVLFADQHGVLRGKTVTADAVAAVLRDGLTVPSTLLLKDTAQRTVPDAVQPGAAGMLRGAGDLLLVPRPETLRLLPWSPHSAWILCTPVHPDGRALAFASSTVLERAGERLARHGLAVQFGQEVEFHILASGHRAGRAGRYLSASRYGAMEPLLDRLRRDAQALGLAVRSVEIEMGPGQVEFTFAPGPALQQADTMVMFRTLAREVCAAEDYEASFMPRPQPVQAQLAPGRAAGPEAPTMSAEMGSGWHLHQSLWSRDGSRNLFVPPDGPQADDTPEALTPQAAGWIAGLLTHAAGAAVLSAPTVNSYKRYRPGRLAPCRIGWGREGRGTMLRALLRPGDAASRIENRAPDSSANPYYALAAQIHAGLSGIEEGLTPPPPTALECGGDGPCLPHSLGAALDAFAVSGLCRDALGGEVVDYLLRLKRSEWERYLDHVSDWEQAEYSALF